MAAEFKSHVLRRDEKGFLGIPFKRWLLSGVGGGLLFAFGSFALGTWSIPVGIAAVIIILVFTGERGGMPLWLRLLFHWRGALIIAAARRPDGLAPRIARLLEVPVESVVLVEGDRLFDPPAQVSGGDFTEWITLVDPHTEDDGLVFVEQAITTTEITAD